MAITEHISQWARPARQRFRSVSRVLAVAPNAFGVRRSKTKTVEAAVSGCDNLRLISYRLSPLNQELSPLLLGYSSLLGQCLRLVSYATGTLPHLRLRAFHRRSSLPSLCYRIASNCVAALYCETPAANDHHGRGGVKRSRLLHLLSLTKTR